MYTNKQNSLDSNNGIDFFALPLCELRLHLSLSPLTICLLSVPAGN